MPIFTCTKCNIEICHPLGEEPAHRCKKAAAAPVPAEPVVIVAAEEPEPEKAPEIFEEGENVDPDAQPKPRRKRFADPGMLEGGK